MDENPYEPPPAEPLETAPPPAPDPPTTWRPVTGDERYAALDVLRGLALFGVLMMNLETCFRVSFAHHILGLHNHSGRADEIVGMLLVVVLQSKAFTLFSFSFGIGMAVQAERAAPRGVGWRWFLVRRFLVLLALGLVHMFLIWNGDILILYAVCGLVLVPLVRLPSWLLAPAGLAAIVVNYRLPMDWLLPTYDFYFTVGDQAAQVYANGGFWEIMLFRWWEAVYFMAPLLVTVIPRTLGMMLLGIAAWRSGLLSRPERHRILLGFVLVVCGAVGGAATVGPLFWPQFSWWTRIPPPVVEGFSYIPLALAYAAAVFLIVGSARAVRIARPLAAVGQMALTNYLTHSVVLGIIFYGYGFALLGKLGPASAALIGLAIYVAQLIASPLWLAQFQFGPVEWLWRSLTYGRWQPIRRVKNVESTDVVADEEAAP